MTIYDAWGWEKKKILESIGCRVEIMWQRTDDTRITSGTEVRKRIANGLPWEHLVPEFVYHYILDRKIDKRIREMFLSQI